MNAVSSAMENSLSSELSSNSSPFLLSKPSSLKRKRPPQIEIPNVLQEIQPDKLRIRDAAHKNDAVCFGGNGFGVVSSKGKKKFMEDSHRIAPCLADSSRKSFFGVYDGHGGCKAAEFVAENLHKNVLEMMKTCKENWEKEEAFKSAYLRTDRDFLEEGVVSGACCVTALIQDQEIIISNLGDCRAVLCREGVAETLTTDHKAERDDERERIENQGGYVEFHRGAWRVHGILAVSRSIGDAHLKKWVIADPETRIVELTQDMEFLVLASDGLWDTVSNQEAVDTVLNVLAQRKGGNDENLNHGHVNVSPLRRVSLVKQQTDIPVQSPKCATPVSNHSIENESPRSPPSKSRKITFAKQLKMRTESYSPKPSPSSNSFKRACRELVNLAVSRGSLDDITVVIIDLNHYKS